MQHLLIWVPVLITLVLHCKAKQHYEEKWEKYNKPIRFDVHGNRPAVLTDSVLGQSIRKAQRYEPHTHINGILKTVGVGLALVGKDDWFVQQVLEQSKPFFAEVAKLAASLGHFAVDGLCVFREQRESGICTLFQYLHFNSPYSVNIQKFPYSDLAIPRSLKDLKLYLYHRLAIAISKLEIETDIDLRSCIQNHVASSDTFKHIESGEEFVRRLAECRITPGCKEYLKNTRKYVRALMTASPNNDFGNAYLIVSKILQKFTRPEQLSFYYRLIVQQLKDDGVAFAEISAQFGVIPGFDLLYSPKTIRNAWKNSREYPEMDTAAALFLCEKLRERDTPSCTEDTKEYFGPYALDALNLRRMDVAGKVFHSDEVKAASMEIAWLVHISSSKILALDPIVGGGTKSCYPSFSKDTYTSPIQYNPSKHVRCAIVTDFDTLPYVLYPIFANTAGFDFAGPEKSFYFNSLENMIDHSSRQSYMENHPLTLLYTETLKTMNSIGRNNFLFHIHAGEGKIFLVSPTPKEWCKNPGSLNQLFPIRLRTYNNNDGSVWLEPLHYTVARRNIALTVEFIDLLKPALGNGADGTIHFRLGHATHIPLSTLEIVQNRGISVDINLGSNIATGSLIPYLFQEERERLSESYSVQEGTSNYMLPTFFLSHSIMNFLANNVPFTIGSDGTGIEKNSLREVEQAVNDLKDFINMECRSSRESLVEAFTSRGLQFIVGDNQPDDCRTRSNYCPAIVDVEKLCKQVSSSKVRRDLTRPDWRNEDLESSHSNSDTQDYNPKGLTGQKRQRPFLE